MPRIAGRAIVGATIAASSAVLLVPHAAAQSVPGALPSREQVEVPRAQETRPSASVTVRDDTPRAADCPFADSTLEVAIDRLRYVQPDGSALPPEALAALAAVAPEAGPRRLVQLCDLRDAAAASLSRAGYVAGVTIPPQEIDAGEARLTVILARLVGVEVVGSAGPHRRTLEARVAQLKALPALNTREIETILLGANDVPGLQVMLALRSAGSGPGEVIGTLSVSYTPFMFLANVQNSGSRTLGRESGSLRAEYYGLTGHADRTFIGVSSTLDVHEQQVVQVGHYFSTDSGVSFGGRFSYAWSRPDLGGLDLRSRSMIGGVDLSVPLRRSVRASSDFGAGFEVIEQRVQLNFPGFGAIPVTQDRLRVGYLRASMREHEPRFGGPDKWGIGASVEVRKGFDLFDATPTATITPAGYAPSRFDGVATATVVRGGVDGFVSLGRLFSLGMSGQAQWASDPLLSFEEFSVGSLTIGRGYDPGVTAGDKAIAVRIEPRLTLPLKSRVGAQAFGFIDVAHIWNDDPFTTENDRSLRSFGGGVRAWLPGLMSLEATYAHPQDPELRFPGAPRASDRVLLSLTVQFAPRR
ncbi:MAG: ShlB/FhaC/HecB family hemolysin secretion/activation protein [Pseudomonadota bacterium]